MSFAPIEETLGTDFQCAQGTAPLECARTDGGNIFGNGYLFQLTAVFESVRSNGSYFIGFSIRFYGRRNGCGDNCPGIWLL